MDINFKENRRNTRRERNNRGSEGKNPKKLYLIIAVAVVLVIGIVIGCIALFNGTQDLGDPITPYIYVSETPTDVEYVVGESLDVTGLVIHHFKSDATIVTVPLSECTFEGFDSTLPNQSLKVTVNYQEMSTYFYVIVKTPTTTAKTIVGIVLENPKKEYSVGEGISLQGTFYRLYSDGSRDKITLEPSNFEEFDTSTTGTKTVKIKYKHVASGRTFYYEYPIEVR